MLGQLRKVATTLEDRCDSLHFTEENTEAVTYNHSELTTSHGHSQSRVRIWLIPEAKATSAVLSWFTYDSLQCSREAVALRLLKKAQGA